MFELYPIGIVRDPVLRDPPLTCGSIGSDRIRGIEYFIFNDNIRDMRPIMVDTIGIVMDRIIRYQTAAVGGIELDSVPVVEYHIEG